MASLDKGLEEVSEGECSSLHVPLECDLSDALSHDGLLAARDQGLTDSVRGDGMQGKLNPTMMKSRTHLML
jgi:hypothetical protein